MLIQGYRLLLNPALNKFRIDVRLQDGQARQVPVENMEEFSAIAELLSHGNVVAHPDGTLEVQR